MASPPKDNFSAQAAAYATFRPRYPQPLYEFLNSLPGDKTTAWDCATGNGQVAAELAVKYQLVYATDISEAQLQHAPKGHNNIRYLACPAESTPLPSQSIDLLTVAQAVHWFRFGEFYQEARRVLKSQSWLALWGYGLIEAENEALNLLIRHFYTKTVGPFWDEERRHIDLHYTSIPFPFAEIPAPSFQLDVQWTRQQFTGYLSSWSSLQHYIRRHAVSPLPAFDDRLQPLWPDAEIKRFHFPIFMRVGRV
ncbi:class I SAM-dependent methyltransferase [Pontibacter litorisediminis]|uniref:class I SAM-dependent methyltransferase n=1 Tax=Pontibacter litorisediminis TaxID=1846260 RepID=UPI0023ED6775|nr:class I SAM-dependent methyltransferase [Pontibacter litorisediminis]